VSDWLKPVLHSVVECERELASEESLALTHTSAQDLQGLCRAASILRDRGKGRVVTFSPKVFIPLTRLCRDFCGYCTFRQSPAEAQSLYMTTEEALEVARAGQRLGCAEALFTLGEHPEQRYVEAQEWLNYAGFRTTLEYLTHVSAETLAHTSMLPHANPGVMSRREMAALRPVNASMGVMLEILSERLCFEGGPHHLAPSKRPSVRLKTLDLAGQLKVPFTTGILIGIGETRKERIESLLAIRESHRRYGHVQEVIVQNFRAKADTAMGDHADAATEDLLWTVAVARLILGPSVNLQVPPNLNQDDYPVFLTAGINDWGGVSPLTIDYVNPEAPWPQISQLRRRTEKMGFELKPRLPIYPEYFMDHDDFASPAMRERLLDMADGDGYVKGGVERYVNASS
jgi:FO synthase